MIEQEANGTYHAVGDKAAGSLNLLGGLFQLAEGDYSPAFLDTELDDEPEFDDEDDDTTEISSEE